MGRAICLLVTVHEPNLVMRTQGLTVCALLIGFSNLELMVSWDHGRKLRFVTHRKCCYVTSFYRHLVTIVKGKSSNVKIYLRDNRLSV